MRLFKEYKFLNNLIGWLVFIFASAVYLMTIEPTASWWDCGEYIATSYKLQVGHPPGAPFFQLMGRFFTLFAFDDVTQVAKMINAMSGIMSGLTILFTFWTITFFARKLYAKEGELSGARMLAVLGAGLVGALAFTFSDSFWFSAVEGEVYATSSMFTAAVVWAMTKWEAAADQKHHLRWIILIAFLMGLSIGVHLLNLLTIPALTYLYYYKKFKPSRKGFIYTGILSVLLLGFIQAGLIPWIVKLAGSFELFFVNSMGMPFNSGTIIYFVVVGLAIILGLYFTHKKSKVVLNTAILAFAFITIGYSSFFMLVIRSNANTPINENAPKDAISLLGYLNREQYGDWPVLYGQYYNARLVKTEEGDYIYRKGQENGKDKYVPISRKIKYKFDPEYCTLFPRMWSDQPHHVAAYKEWTGIASNRKPSFSENLSFLFRNQLGNQYFRYFMWNFAGRQNDIQGFGLDGKGNKDIQQGNWISGIGFLDAARLGAQSDLPERQLNNKARNTFFLLPLLLGLLGMYFHFKKQKKDAFVVMLLFFMTGIAIILFLNPTPHQPRERDYAYAGSFYAFSIWIGLGVVALFELLRKKAPALISAALATVVSLFAVPVLMGAQGWDDHDRSDKYACRDFAKNYLNSCQKNAILITNGDNDTFPLWYAQEVEGVRTDIRVVNFTLASGDWYIHQLFNKLYDSEPLPLMLKPEQYTTGTNDFVSYYEQAGTPPMSVRQLVEFISSDDPDKKARTTSNREVAYFPTKSIYIPVDSLKVLRNGTVPASLADRIPRALELKIKKDNLLKNDIMLLDFLATNNWDRPIYFASPNGVNDLIDISDYCYLEGNAYHFIPVKSDSRRDAILADRSFELMTKDFVWGNLADPSVYCDKESYQMSQIGRNSFARVAQALVVEGKKSKAIACLDKGVEVFPDVQVPYDLYMIGYAELYFQCGVMDKGTAILNRVVDVYDQNLRYYGSLDNKRQRALDQEIQEAAQILQYVTQIAQQYKLDALFRKADGVLRGI